jgi:hypothetical protein
MRVIDRVNAETKEVVYGPPLQGTLKLTNTAEDQTARLVSGDLTYVDAKGAAIKLADGRGDAEIAFSSYGTDQLDPGADLSKEIDVPFLAAALDGHPVTEVHVNVEFVPAPYREATAAFKVPAANQ